MITKYKAKTIETGEWVTGVLRSWNNNTSDIIVNDTINVVDSNTLCKSTDIKDMEGNDVFTGDQYNVYGNDKIYTVYEKNAAICGGINFEAAYPLGWDCEEPQEEHTLSWFTECALIKGNIHDNK